jgi:hypothetical protein
MVRYEILIRPLHSRDLPAFIAYFRPRHWYTNLKFNIWKVAVQRYGIRLVAWTGYDKAVALDFVCSSSLRRT